MTLHQYEISIQSLIPNIILYRNQHWHLKMLAPLSSKFIAGDFTFIWLTFCLTFRMLTPQPLSGVLEATACIFLYPQRVQRVSSYSWKFAGTLKIKDICSLFEWIFVWLFVRVILFYWLFLLRLKFIWYTADSKKNTKNRSSKFTHKKKGSQSESSV